MFLKRSWRTVASIFGILLCVGPLTLAAASELSACVPLNRLLERQIFFGLPESQCLREWLDAESIAARKPLEDQPIYKASMDRLRALSEKLPRTPTDLGERNNPIYISSGSIVQRLPDGTESVVINGQRFTDGWTISRLLVSPNGRRFLYAVSVQSGDIHLWRAYDLDTQQEEGPIRIRFRSIRWARDSHGFFYHVWPSQVVEEKLRLEGAVRNIPLAYHKIGTPLSEDEIVFESDDPGTSMPYAADRIDDKRVLIFRDNGFQMVVFISEKVGKRYVYKKIRFPTEKLKIRGSYLGIEDNKAYFYTGRCGTNRGIEVLDLRSAEKLDVLVPCQKDLYVHEAQLVGGKLHILYFNDVLRSQFRTFSLDGKLLKTITPANLGLPPDGSFTALNGTYLSRRAFFSFSSVGFPPVAFEYAMGDLGVKRLPATGPHPLDGFNPIHLQVREFKSFDGVKVPIQVYTRKDQIKPKFVLLFHYGQNGANYLPGYNTYYHLITEMNGAVAFVNSRGGGERGDDWTEAAIKSKMITIRDIAWGSKWLQKEFKLGPQAIVADGSSYGGFNSYMLLTDYAKEFGGLIASAPISDLRYWFSNLIGFMFVDDLNIPRGPDGRLTDVEGWFRRMDQLSPLRRIAKMKHVTPILTIGKSGDDRTGPEQYMAMHLALRAKFPENQEIQLMDFPGGHSGAPNFASLKLAYLAKLCGVTQLMPVSP